MSWVKVVERLAGAGRKARALDVLYTNVDAAMSVGEFEAIDGILASLDLDAFDTSLQLGFLSITRAAKDKLKERAGLYGRIHARLVASDPTRVDALLQGLE